MSSPRWTAVLFDLDGTLVDTIPLIVASYEHAMRTVLPGVAFTPEQARAWIGRTLRAAFAESYPEHAEALEAAYVPFNLANTERLIARYDGVDEMVRSLLDAEVRIGVATSKRAETAVTALRHAGLDTLIDLVATMESTDRHKPDPAPLQHAAARLSTPAYACVYVGDAVVDVRAAQAAGMASIAVTWGAGIPEALAAARPDYIVETPADLTSILLPPNGTGL